MALPLILTPIILSAAIKGVDSISNGMDNLSFASSTSKELEKKYKLNIEYFEKKKLETTNFLDNLGKKELEIFESFERFAMVIEQIKNKPVFKKYTNDEFIIPEYNSEEIKKISMTAALILGGLSSVGVGIAGGIATGGITTTLISTLGTASTGVAIETLSGAAASNAILALLGGGTVTAGGGGVAVGSVLLGGATLGIGVLAGGVLFEKYTETIKEKIEKMYTEVDKTVAEINEICSHLEKLKEIATKFKGILILLNRIYQYNLLRLSMLVFKNEKKDWDYYTEEEKKLVENTILLVRLLYNLGKTRLLLIPETENKIEEVNENGVISLINSTKRCLNEKELKEYLYI